MTNKWESEYEKLQKAMDRAIADNDFAAQERLARELNGYEDPFGEICAPFEKKETTVEKKDDLEECSSCGDYDKLKYAYGMNDQKLYPKKVCRICRGEMEDSDKEAFNNYYFPKYR